MLQRLHLVIKSLLLLLISSNSFAQVSDSLFELSCQHEDIIILNEEKHISIEGQKIYLMVANVTNNLTFIIKTEKALEEFQPYLLPRKFDELHYYHAPSVRNIEWDFENIRIHEFQAEIKNSKRTQTKLKITPNIKEKRVLDEEGFFGHINQYEYFFDDLKVGDTLILKYVYEIPFRENWLKLLSNRIFFNGKYPKKNFQLSWCYNKDLVVDSLFVNHDIPEVTFKGNKICYYWEFNNLSGCLDEPQSRPYESLASFIFVPQPYGLEYTHFDSYKQEFIPIYYFEASKRQMELNTERRDVLVGNKNKNNIYYQRVADKINSISNNDSVGLLKMRFFQQFLVDSVKYHPSFEYYNHEKHIFKQKAGMDLYAYQVYDHNLERIYGNMVPRMGMTLFTAYPIDKRSGEISPLYNSTVKDNDLIFAVLMNNGKLGMLIPKSDKNNYYFNELPFYYEDISVLLMDISDFGNTSLLGGKRNFNSNFRRWETPNSTWGKNFRKTQSSVNIRLKDNITDFQTRIILSGQYSTLTRNIYSDFSVDSTINPKYLESIWDIADDVEVNLLNSTTPFIYFPFKTTITSEYTSKQIFTIENGKYKFKPGKWFKLIYADGILNSTRFLDYYPDFIGSDKYSYLLDFDQKIELISDVEEIKVKNKYCQLYVSIKQIDDNKIMINCTYNILTNRIEKNSINMVQEINQAILDLNELTVEFELKE